MFRILWLLIDDVPLTHSLRMMPWGIPRHNPHDASRHSQGFSDVRPQGIIFSPCLAAKCEQRYPSSIFGVSLMWSVIVAFTPAPPSRYKYNVSRTWVGIVGKYKEQKSFVYHNKQRLSQSLRVALSKWVRRRGNCDVTMIVANGLMFTICYYCCLP